MNAACDLVRDNAGGYVLGALTPDEEREVREHLATCREAHPELEELGGVVPYLAESVPLVEPPAALKDRIMAAAAADLVARQPAAPRPAIPRSTTAIPSSRPWMEALTGGRRPPAPGAWVAGVAAVLAIVVVAGWNLTLQRDLEDARGTQAALSAVLEIASQAGAQTAILSGEGEGAPTGLAAVGSDGRLAIVMRDLPPTTGTEVYEAWVIGGAGTPVPVGDFRVDSTGRAALVASDVPVEPGVTVALTREPGPGATTPTLPIVSAGQATAPSS